MISKKQLLWVCTFSAVLLTGVGTAAFAQNPPNSNTAYGTGALSDEPFCSPAPPYYGNGCDNNDTAFGYEALYNNDFHAVATRDNTAIGSLALYSNTNGVENTATGSEALYSNQSSANTADGFEALASNTNGNSNTASGEFALLSNTSGYSNTASGTAALQRNTIGYNNTADGDQALLNNTTGYRNTAAGVNALASNQGHDNIGVGVKAGYNVTSGANDIEIGAIGSSADTNTIRLGTQGTQTATYVAGIFGTPMTGGDVVVNSSGRLGVLSSSARYKRDIHALNNSQSTKLWQLRPVTFRYKQDPQGQRQYGLIAEEVAKVYPELVVRGDKGDIESVQYRELIPLMLNEMRRQQTEMQSEQAALAELRAQNQMLRAALAQQTTVFTARLERLERTNTLASR